MRPRDIKAHVEKYYSRFYRQEQGRHLPIKTGKDLAASLGYPLDNLRFVPEEHWEKFIPCGNPLPHLRPAAGERILNLGCGASIDSYALSGTVGVPVSVVGMDVVHEIMARAMDLTSRQHFGESTLCWVCGDGEQLPFRDESFNWVITNGVLNLFPDKPILLGQIHRILKPTGRFVCADLCSGSTLPDYFHDEPDSWAWCMSGACTEQDLTDLIDQSGFELIHFSREEEVDLLYRVTFACRKRRAAKP
jgi:SAM-dependent methyltransferase